MIPVHGVALANIKGNHNKWYMIFPYKHVIVCTYGSFGSSTSSQALYPIRDFERILKTRQQHEYRMICNVPVPGTTFIKNDRYFMITDISKHSCSQGYPTVYYIDCESGTVGHSDFQIMNNLITVKNPWTPVNLAIYPAMADWLEGHKKKIKQMLNGKLDLTSDYYAI